MPNHWEFKCYKDRRGKVIVKDWLKQDLSKKAWAKAKRAMEILANRPIQDWHKPNPASLLDVSDSIYVIRFKDENSTQRRIYGFHDSQLCFFVMTNYGTEKDGKYAPSSSDAAKQAESARLICYQHWDESVCTCIEHSTDTGLSIAERCPA